MFLVKLGGSVVTVKGRYGFYRQKAVDSIIRELIGTGEQFALVHGGGSFGHIKAKEYGLPGKISSRTEEGYSLVHRDMVDLNQKIVSSMIDAGLRGFGVPPAVFNGNLRAISDSVEFYTSLGFYPVTFGDVYPDMENKSFGIISGDDLMVELAGRLRPDKVAFLTDVDGIYDRNPKTSKNAKLLKTMNEKAVFEQYGTDVTGGMEKKAKSIMDITVTGAEVYVLNGNHPERIRDIGNDRFIGTVIK